MKRRVALITRALQQPAAMVGKAGTGAVLVITLALVQLSLEMAGRRYADDFASFHDHEHWPGYALVALRVCLAAVRRCRLTSG